MSKRFTARYDDCSTLDPPRPDRVAVFMHRDGAWESTEWFDLDEIVSLRDALNAELASRLPEPEVRGYVVLVPTAAGPFEVGGTGTVFSDARSAIVEAAWAAESFGLAGAHVGVVTALPAPSEIGPSFPEG